MRSLQSDPQLDELAERVLHHASEFGRTLPEMRFFILDHLEFASLLEKNVYPTSPINIWEGKRMVHKKHRIETGQESSLYYEVVQTGNPSYAYLNDGNSPVTQASVMAHVVGHCEFSEINVLKDSTADRTEFVMYLVKKAEIARQQMGTKDYLAYWNACESASTLIAANSQYNLERSVETESEIGSAFKSSERSAPEQNSAVQPVFDTLTSLLHSSNESNAFEGEVRKKRRSETLSRRGYSLRAPCQDVLGFLREHAPTSQAESAVLDYLYVVRAPQEFVMRTQIMNEGWAMYWEKKIMLELFKEKAVDGIIDYARVFSQVCSPRPYFQRNPYHLGYNLWCHIEELYRDGKMSLAYREEIDQSNKDTWKRDGVEDPIEEMERIVRSNTDFGFLRRFLTPQVIHDFHLNRIDRASAGRLGVTDADIVQMDKYWCWLNPESVKEAMLSIYSHFFRPRIYVIDSDFLNGGLLLFHRDDKQSLRRDWIRPTLNNLTQIWKGHVALLSGKNLFRFSDDQYREGEIEPVTFEQILERMRKGRKPFRLE